MSEFDGDDDWHSKYTTTEYRDYINRKALLGIAESNGKKYSSGASGKKYDDGKLKMGMVLSYFADAFEGVAACGTYGNKKYADGYWDYNWNNLTDAEMRYMDAGMRHLLEHMKGNLIDEESGLPHIDHAIWNFMAVSQLIKERKE